MQRAALLGMSSVPSTHDRQLTSLVSLVSGNKTDRSPMEPALILMCNAHTHTLQTKSLPGGCGACL